MIKLSNKLLHEMQIYPACSPAHGWLTQIRRVIQQVNSGILRSFSMDFAPGMDS